MSRAEKRRQQKKAAKEARRQQPEQDEYNFSEQQMFAAQQSLGLAQQHFDAGRLPQAEKIYQKILQNIPIHPVALHMLGYIANQKGESKNAVDLISRAVVIAPDYVDAHSNLGNALRKIGKLDEAVASYHKALALEPNFAQAHYNLGITLMELGRLGEAIASYRKAVAIEPGFEKALVALLHQLRNACEWLDVEGLELKIGKFTKQSILEGRNVAHLPFNSVASSMDASENFAVASAKSTEIAKKIFTLKPNFQTPTRKSAKSTINIGYVSNDFYNHATSHLMLSLFGLHDRDDFRIFTFSHGSDDESMYRKKIKNDSDKFFDLQDSGHLEAASKIFETGVDILIDLKGHTRGNRLEIFALRPAPVQATYLGFPGTTGGDFMDYIITDRTVTPEDQSPYYSEQFVYLPHCYQVNDHEQKIHDIPFIRSDFGLPEKGFVFCSFNSNYKIEPIMFGVWMNLLKKTKDSVLWLFRSNELSERNLKNEAKARGVDEDRLIFAEHMPKNQHLERCRLADLALDTRIYGGHTTTSDFLWAGVPVVSLLGTHFASRVAATLLKAVGLPELITQNLEAYEALALRLSQNFDELNKLKAKLTKNRLSEPLFDTPLFVSNLENAYRRMWENYLSGKPPSRIDLI